jgi:hypothetical protein
MSGYKKGCEQLDMHLLDIPDEWAPFATSPAPTSTTEGATTQTTTLSSTSVAATTLTQTSSMASSTSSQVTTSTITETSLASPSTSLNLPDAQIPICGVRTHRQLVKIHPLTITRYPKDAWPRNHKAMLNVVPTISTASAKPATLSSITPSSTKSASTMPA